MLLAVLPLLTWLGRTEESMGRRALVGGVAFATIIVASCGAAYVVLEGLR